MDLEGVLLSEISQIEKDFHCMISQVECKRPHLETKRTKLMARGWETGNWRNV